jgi:capsid protein
MSSKLREATAGLAMTFRGLSQDFDQVGYSRPHEN